MTTKLLLTGGTIDKNYNEFNGEFNFIETHMPELLAKGRSRADVSVQQLMMKDSLDMTDADRELIVKTCKQTKADKTFNIGFALAAAQIKSTGVYIAMNGTLFDYDKVVKNRELAEFQSI